MRLPSAFFFPIPGLLLSVALLHAQVSVRGKVEDENGLGVAGARVQLRVAPGTLAASTISDLTGSFSMSLKRPGEYQIHTEREAYFVFTGKAILQEGENRLEITLNHLREFAESVSVTYSPPAIDLEEPAERKQLNNRRNSVGALPGASGPPQRPAVDERRRARQRRHASFQWRRHRPDQLHAGRIQRLRSGHRPDGRAPEYRKRAYAGP